MTKTLPNVVGDAHYELREAASALGISKATLLKWTRDGLIRAGTKRVNRRKFWTGSEIVRCWKSVI